MRLRQVSIFLFLSFTALHRRSCFDRVSYIPWSRYHSTYGASTCPVLTLIVSSRTPCHRYCYQSGLLSSPTVTRWPSRFAPFHILEDNIYILYWRESILAPSAILISMQSIFHESIRIIRSIIVAPTVWLCTYRF